QLISQSRNGVTAYFHLDAMGTTRALTNSGAQVTDRFVFDAFGRQLRHLGTTVTPYLFVGEQRDAGSGLDYLRARYYDVHAGRFLSTDPLAGTATNPFSFQRYIYANADPVNHRDPSGQLTMLEVQLISAGIGILAGLAVGLTAHYVFGV